jgi:uncharacterized protein with NRDE domain
MCLLVLAWMSHPRYRLVAAGNRDEFHDRPTAPLGWWADEPAILAGRDLQAGGTWMGVSRSGRFGVLTNFRDAEARPPGASPSRGRLVKDYLRADLEPAAFVDALGASAREFAGFNLLVGDGLELHYVSNAAGPASRPLPPGVYGLGNHRLDEPWPKLVRTRERFATALTEAEMTAARLFDVLADSTPERDAAPAASGLPPDLELALSAPFVRHAQYGTRCTTIAFIEHGGRTIVFERRFDASGVQSGATRVEFAGAGK